MLNVSASFITSIIVWMYDIPFIIIVLKNLFNVAILASMLVFIRFTAYVFDYVGTFEDINRFRLRKLVLLVEYATI